MVREEELEVLHERSTTLITKLDMRFGIENSSWLRMFLTILYLHTIDTVEQATGAAVAFQNAIHIHSSSLSALD